jgi:hypothetical protein
MWMTVPKFATKGKDAQGRMVDDNIQETTHAVMEDPIHYDEVVNNRNQDGQDKPHSQYADGTVQPTQQLMRKRRRSTIT